MSTVEEHPHRAPAPGKGSLAQAIVLAVLVAVAGVVFWLYVNDQEWYVPAMALIVLARFAYDRFFAEA